MKDRRKFHPSNDGLHIIVPLVVLLWVLAFGLTAAYTAFLFRFGG